MSKPKSFLETELLLQRGMSEPFFFRASVLKPGNKVLIHAVLFTSFEVTAKSEDDITICSDDKDPRMAAFIKFVWDNYLEKRSKELEDALFRATDGVAKSEQGITKLQQELAELARKHRIQHGQA